MSLGDLVAAFLKLGQRVSCRGAELPETSDRGNQRRIYSTGAIIGALSKLQAFQQICHRGVQTGGDYL
jgi:hypothetical protein